MSNLNTIRRQLNQIIEEAAADLEARELATAAALETHTPQAVKTAVRDALRYQREFFVDLIDQQLEALESSGKESICLRTLKRMVRDGD